MFRSQKWCYLLSEDTAVDFSWQEWQDLGAAQDPLRDVMLGVHSSLVSLGHFRSHPDTLELLSKLKCEFGPWDVSEVSVHSLLEKS